MSDRNEEVSASHQAAAEAAASVQKNRATAEEFQQMLAAKRKEDDLEGRMLRDRQSLTSFFMNVIQGLKGKSPDAAPSPLSQPLPAGLGQPPAGMAMGPGQDGTAPKGLEAFMENPFSHLREARAARIGAMTPDMPAPKAPSQGPSLG